MKDKKALIIDDVYKSFDLPNDSSDSLKIKILSAFKKSNRGKTKHEALKGVSLSVRQGEFVGILGRNGAGKSTLLKIIAGIYQPNNGSVEINGRLAPFIELGVGFNKNLSGRDNVYLNAAMLGFSREETDEMYDSIVEFAELHKFMDQKLRNYSSGMKVRLAFSISIKADADILLLDEVLAVGDAAFKRKCYDYFNTLKERKKTIILVTHNMSAVRDYCDRAILLDDGKVSFDGGPEEAATHYFQLFNPSRDPKAKEKKITINDLSVRVSGNKLSFEMSATNQTLEQLNDTIVRVVIKKQNGRVVAGFDNKNIEQPFEIDFIPGENKKLIFESPNIMNTGSYAVNASISGAADSQFSDEDEDESIGVVVYDNKPNIAHFSVKKTGSAGPVTLPAAVINQK